MGNKPWRIAHRGASGNAPENTMAAFRLARELGAQFIETDLHASSDGELILLHDDTLDRTTNAKGPVAGKALAELRALDAGTWFGRQYAGERMPLLKELIDFSEETGMGLYLEVKFACEEQLFRKLGESVVSQHAKSPCIVLCFSSEVLDMMRRISPGTATGLLAGVWSPDLLADARKCGANQLALRADAVNEETVRMAHGEGFPVVAWTANEGAEILRLAESGADGIMSNYPERLKRLVG